MVDPREHPKIGTMQYAETLPLEDHEVVLTFDDGPLPKYSNQVLDILASECVKATFFVIGRMARDYPAGVRKLRDAGHSIGTHSQNHPLSMNRMPIEQAKREIDDGIAATTAALGGDSSALSPFFRIPGLLRAEIVEDYLASQGIQTWSADFPADDWRHISASQVYNLAMSRIEAKGKGILLLHDIQARTVAALPNILRDLKARGYRIVHVVPATKDLPKTPTEPQQWRMHPVSEAVAISHWPAIPGFAFARSEMLPIPAMPQSGLQDGALMMLPEPFDRVKRLARGAVPLPLEAPWPRLTTVTAVNQTASLPVPEMGVFQIPEKTAVPIRAVLAIPQQPHQAVTTSAEAGDGIGRLIEASSANRPIPGSLRIAKPGLQPTPEAEPSTPSK